MQLTNFLAAISGGAGIGIGVPIGIIVGALAGFFMAKFLISKKGSNSKSAAVKILEEAYAEAKQTKKEAILEAKEEILKMKSETDGEIKVRKAEISKAEDHILQRENFLNQKELSLDKKQESIDKLKNDLAEKAEDVEKLKGEQKEILGKMVGELERVAGMKREEAKNQLISEMTESARNESYKIVREIEEKAQEEGQKKAQNIVATAIQRMATDVTSEYTTSTVSIPNDEMKGRIIGREGRNIKALETATGVDFIVDDTPESITISSFDPVRREIARITLEKLILDGRIHPTRIEEIVEKAQKDVDQKIKEAGENATQEAAVFGLHPELVKTLGRLKYRTSYGQNCLKHSLETSFIAGLLATELDADVKICKRAGLLHDIGKAVDHDSEGTHVTLGVELAKKFKESHAVIHCIEAHHFNVEFQSVEAIIVQIADAISSARPGARRETMEAYVKRLEQLEAIASGMKGVERCFAVQAGREVRVVVKPEQISDESAAFLAKDIAKKIEDTMDYPGQIKVNVIRESRFTETAK